MSNLQKHEVTDNDNVVFFYYTMPDWSSWSQFNNQAKPFLNELATAIPLWTDQTKELYEKIKQANSTNDQIKNDFDSLQQNHISDKQTLENDKLRLTNEKSTIEAEKLLLARQNEDLRNECEALKQEITEERELNQAAADNSEEAKQEINELKKNLESSFKAISNLTIQLEAIKKLKQAKTSVYANQLNELLKRANDASKQDSESKGSPESSKDYDNDSVILEEDSSKNKGKNIKVKLNITLPDFHGRPEENISEWLYGVQRSLEMASYNDKEKVALASSALRDLARSDYLAHEQELAIQNKKYNYQEFSEYMKKKYTPANHSEIIRDKIKNLKQLTSVKEFYVDFRKLAIQASGMNEEEKKSHFMNNLKPQIASWVKLKKCTTIEQAYDEAETYETFVMDSKDKSYDPTYSYSATNPQYSNQNRNRNNNSNRNISNSNSNNNSNDRANNNQNNNNTNNTSNNNNNNYRANNNQNSNNNKNASNNNDNSYRSSNNNNNDNRTNGHQESKYPKETCTICSKIGHTGKECEQDVMCENCKIKGHSTKRCRRNLVCARCNKRGHEEVRCYAKLPTANFMTLSTRNNIPKWIATINGIEVTVALDSGAEKSVISINALNKLNLEAFSTGESIETSNGDYVQVKSTQPIELIFEAIPATLSFNVTSLRAVDCLLGIDFFKQTGVILDPKNDSFILPRRVIKTNQINHQNDDIFNNDEPDYTLNMLSLEHDDLDSEYVDDSAFYSNNELDLSKMNPIAKIKPELEEEFKQLLEDNKSSFATSIEQIGCIKGVKFRVETTSEQPVYSTPYRQPPALATITKEELKILEKAGIIRKGRAGTWTCPGYTLKQNGKYRFVCNYKKVNDVTKLLKFPLPRIDDLLDSFYGSIIFSLLDLRRGFHHGEVWEEHKHKLGFITQEGVYEWNRIPFGVCNGPSFFSSIMQNILGDLPWVKFYIDDLAVASNSHEEHLEHLKILFQRLNEHNLKINPDKCVFFAEEIKLLGHIISKDGIKMDPAKVEAIKNRKPPTNVKEVLIFLGMTGYYRRFVVGYASIVAPLHRLTSTKVVFIWATECQEAFDKLKEIITSYPILRIPDFNKPFILHCDASFVALGCTLAQIDEESNLEYACGYFSKLLKDYERNYTIPELECLAVIWGVNLNKIYLIRNEFVIYTDNVAVRWVLETKNPNSKLSKFQWYLSPYKCKILHRSGKSNGNADALSRPTLLTLHSGHEKQDHSLKSVDPYFDACLLNYLKFRRHIPGASNKQVKRVEKHAPFYRLNEDESISARKNINDEFTIKIPKPSERQEIILTEHEIGHPKTDGVISRLKEKQIQWKNMQKDIEKILALCDVCIRHDKIIKQGNPAQAINIDTIFQRLGIDCITGFPMSKNGYSILLVIVEYLTKFAWAFPMKTKSADEIGKHLQTLICTFGPPGTLISDAGRDFLNQVVEKLCERFQIVKRTTSSYNPACNGQTERTNGTLTRILTKLADDNPTNWPDKIDVTLMAYRTAVHSSTKFTPFELMFGRKFGQFDDYIIKGQEREKYSIENRLIELKTLFEDTHEKAQQNITTAQTKQVNTQNKATKIAETPLKQGDTVYIKDCRLITKKMDNKANGPFIIEGRNIDGNGNGNYILKNKEGEILKATYPRWKLRQTEDYTKIEELKQVQNTTYSSKNEIKNNANQNSESNQKTIQAQKNQEFKEKLTTTTSTKHPIETIQDNSETTNKPKYKINYIQKILKTNSFEYQIEYPDGKKEWITDKEIDGEILINYQNGKGENKPKYKINSIQKIGRGFTYQVEYPDGRKDWIAGKEIDQDILQNHLKTTKTKYKSSDLCPNTLITIIIIIGLFLNSISASKIVDNFIHCQTKGLNRIIKPNSDCKHPKEIQKALARHNTLLDDILHKEKLPSDIMLVSRNKYYMNEIGYQCFQTRKTTFLNETWLFKTSRNIITESMHLTRMQCLTMVESKTCDNNPMNCNNDGCWYTSKQVEQYYYNTDFKIETIDCSFIKKQVTAQFENSQLYFSPTNECKPKDLECKLFDSIVVWTNSSRNNCLLTNIHNGTNYTLSQNQYFDQHNIVYSTTDNLSFQLTGTFFECNVRLFRTTTDTYIIFKNDPEAYRYNEIENANERISFNKQHDINNILLSESDSDKHLQWVKTQERIHHENFIECNEFKNNVNTLSLQQDTLNKITDPNGNTVYTYSMDGLVYLPFCTPINAIFIEKFNDCHQEQKILYEVALPVPHNRTGFLTTTNMIKDESPKVSCEFIRYNQLLPSNQQMIIRRRETTTIIDTSHLIIHDIAQVNHVHTQINFNHHNEIIANFQPNALKLEFERNKDSSDQERFYSLPNDQHISDIQFKSKTSESIAEINNKILDFITTSTIATTIIGSLTTLFMIYVAYKVVILIIASCICKDHRVETQVNRIPIQVHEAEMREKFVRRIENSNINSLH